MELANTHEWCPPQNSTPSLESNSTRLRYCTETQQIYGSRRKVNGYVRIVDGYVRIVNGYEDKWRKVNGYVRIVDGYADQWREVNGYVGIVNGYVCIMHGLTEMFTKS